MKQQAFVLVVTSLLLIVAVVLTRNVEKVEDQIEMQEMLSQENLLTEDQIRNIDQTVVDELYAPSNTQQDSDLGFNLTIVVNDVVQ